MTRFIFRMSDSAVAFLWTWFGIRRRWLLPPAALLALVDARWSVGWVFFGVVILACTVTSFVTEKHRGAAENNVRIIEFRQKAFTQFFTIGFAILAVASVAGVFNDTVSIRDAVSQVGIFAFWMLDNTLIPTGPRRRIRFPKFSFGAQKEAFA